MAFACGVGIRRDYSTIPPGQVGFDDMCGLQDYFDSIEAHLGTAPRLANAVDVEGTAGKPIRGGKDLYRFETDFQLKQLRRTLDENWKRLPDQLAGAKSVEVEVHWSEKAGVKRVVTDSDPQLIIDHEGFTLPYHVCLSELLYGEPLYRQRREMSGRSLPSRPLLDEPGPAAGGGDGNSDGGAPSPIARFLPTPDAGRPDAGAAGAYQPQRDGGAAPVFKTAPPAR